MSRVRLNTGFPAHWRAARELGQFTYDELAAAVDGSYQQASTHVRKMEEAGAVRVAGQRDDRRTVFEVIDRDRFDLPSTRPAAAPARVESLHGNMWTAMRQLATFSPRDIAVGGGRPKRRRSGSRMRGPIAAHCSSPGTSRWCASLSRASARRCTG